MLISREGVGWLRVFQTMGTATATRALSGPFRSGVSCVLSNCSNRTLAFPPSDSPISGASLSRRRLD